MNINQIKAKPFIVSEFFMDYKIPMKIVIKEKYIKNWIENQ